LPLSSRWKSNLSKSQQNQAQKELNLAQGMSPTVDITCRTEYVHSVSKKEKQRHESLFAPLVRNVTKLTVEITGRIEGKICEEETRGWRGFA
jgi:hypothetical protein